MNSIASAKGPEAQGAPPSEAVEGELARLRREVADAHEIIRAIEEAYLAGEGAGPGQA